MAALSLRSVFRWPFGGRLPIGAITELNRLPPINWVDCNTCGPGGSTCSPYATPFAVPAFLACVRVISEGVASLPKRIIRRLPDGSREPDTGHWLYTLLHDAPNPWQSSFEYFEGLAADVAAWGNHYSVKQYGDGGQVVALLPLEPWRVTVSQLENQMLVYDYVAPNGDSGRFRDDQVLHVRGMSRDGISGECPVDLLTGPLGLAAVMERYSSRFWSNNAKPGLVLETAQPIPREALVEVLRQFEAAHRGAENAGKTAALPVGVSVRAIDGATAQAEQMIEMRTFIIQEIARAMRVPPSLIGENSRSTFSNAEQEQLSWVTNSLAMWCRRIEGAFNRALVRETDTALEMHIDVRGLLRGDSAARATYYQTMFQLAAMSPAEIRALEDMPPVNKPGMDDYYVPVNNYAPIGQAPPEAPPAGHPGPFGRSLRGSPDQPRDEGGRWTSGGGGSGSGGSSGGSGGSGGGSGGATMTPEAAASARESHREARKVSDYTPANPDAVETNQRFKTSDGSYTPARAAMHDEVVGDALAGVPKSDNPTLYMMGGGPAAGKSSIISSGAVEHPAAHVMANPDTFKEDIPEYRAGLASGNLDAAAQAHEESSDLNVRAMQAAADGGHDTVWDGTGDSSIEKLQEKVETFKAKGFQIQADYVTCDTDAAVARATARAAKTGRQVPEKDIRDTHAKVSKIWPEAVRRGLFDRSDLYDTNAGGKPVRIASAKGTSLTIHNQAAYDRFLAKAGG